MKAQIKEEINKLYSLFKKPPKLDVNNVKQHIETFTYNKKQITPLRKAVNEVISSGRCAWCNASKAKVQESFKDEPSREEYQISALCQKCQDEVFTTVNKNSRFEERQSLAWAEHPDNPKFDKEDKCEN